MLEVNPIYAEIVKGARYRGAVLRVLGAAEFKDRHQSAVYDMVAYPEAAILFRADRRNDALMLFIHSNQSTIFKRVARGFRRAKASPD